MQLKRLEISICQLNPTIAAIKNNTNKIISEIETQKKQGSNLLIFPELSISGYPPTDLLLRPSFHEKVKLALQEIRLATANITIIIGYPEYKNGNVYNNAAVISNQEIIHTQAKQILPNYQVFDEKRYFTPGTDIKEFHIGNIKCCLAICEDVWDLNFQNKVAALRPNLVFAINASPFMLGKPKERQRIVSQAAKKIKSNCIYANMCGAQDELVFDGGSFISNSSGTIVAAAPQFNNTTHNYSYEVAANKFIAPELSAELEDLEQIYKALSLGIKDYVNKNNFPGVLVGLSGGIDSALTLAICYDAIGKDRVTAVLLPSGFTSNISTSLARQQADNLNISTKTIGIDDIYQATLKTMKLKDNGSVTVQNIQARVRANILMAESNETGNLLINTSNRSEIATGFGTLYGDMAGAFAALKNIPKTMVYELANWRNSTSYIIPNEVISREPSAELCAAQKDTDTLPPYPILDEILSLYLDKNYDTDTIVKAGFCQEQVVKVINMIKKSEFKRQQFAPGVQLTANSFGIARRIAITSGADD
ncbi:MAG: NAD+ synthase [Legionellales bacterium]|jgi:NAD+ synthase (glutamine-hydrolysing)|nr:NAD+ synthase [Legionellales bacterium]